MRIPAAAALAGMALLSTLAGCSGDGGGQTDLLAAPSEEEAVAALDLATLSYAGIEVPLHHVVWANGTVATQDSCNTGGCAIDETRAFHRTDLTPHLLAGVPMQVTVELLWNEPPVAFGSFDAYLEAPETTVYASRAEYEPGHLLATAILRPTGTVTLVMAAYGPGGDVPATAYTLSVRIDADPVALMPGVPVAVALDAGDRLVATSYGGGKARFLLYGPDDALLGTFDGEHALPDGAPAGDYVAVLPAGGPTGNLSSDSGAVDMRALALRIEQGPSSDVPPSGPIEAPWEVTGFPLGVGLFVGVDDDQPVPFIASTGLTASLTGPNGFGLDAGEVCGLCVSGGFGYRIGSGSGDPRVTAGTYTVHAESTGAGGARVQPFAVYLDR